MPSSCLFFAAGLHSVKSLNSKVNDGYWFRKTGGTFLFSNVVPIVSFEKPTRLFFLETKDTRSNYVSGFFALILVFLPIRVGRWWAFCCSRSFFFVSSIPIKRKSFSPLLSPIFTPLLCTQKAIAHIKGTFWRKFASLLDFLVIEYVLLVCGGAYFSGKVACIAEEDCLLIFLDMHSMCGLHAYSQLQSMG